MVEIDHRPADDAADLALRHDRRTLDALHVAAAMLLPAGELVVATYRRLRVLPTVLPEEG